MTVKNGIICSFILGVTLLTGYLAPFYIGLLGLLLIYKSIKEKQSKNIFFLFGYLIFAVLIAWGCYLSYFNGFISDRAQEVVIYNIHLNAELLKQILKNFIYYLYYPLSLILCGFLGFKLMRSRPKFNAPKLSFYVFSCALLWSIIVMIVVPFKVVRYLFPVLPLLSLAFPLFLSAFKGKERKLYIILFSIIFAVCGLFPQSVESSDTGYPHTKRITPLQSRIENLFVAQKHIYIFTKEPQIPVYITADYFSHYMEITPIMSDNQLYKISYVIPIVPFNLEAFYLLLIKDQIPNIDAIRAFYDIAYESNITRGNTKIIKFVHKKMRKK